MIAPYKGSDDTLENMVIHLFQKGITMTDIAQYIERMYAHHLLTADDFEYDAGDE